ncbi:target of Myb protein 1-like isoform X2 [Notolabrus celidotus]|uniref:target of Myb protein 1-like isoform X2 n=1 Tax=Notolabrus celidotus TaxID=1203425 RepID=UPI0014903A1F|nr:target of Myb protein 1-like isoform X2 [Notolabrus celidotus]
MEICDIINETDEGPRDAVKAVKKRIIGNKNFREIMLALTVLETCVKNCGHRFQVLVASQDFVEGVLVRSILPKYNPPTALHDRVLSLIQSWADAFRSSPSLAGVVYVYDDLRRRGLEFPMTDLDALSPIHTPNRSIPENGTADTAPESAPTPPEPQEPPSVPPQNTPPAINPSEGPVTLSAEQEQKLRNDIALIRGISPVMSEMLNELTPGQIQHDDTELLQQLYSVCKNMQTRVVELIPQLLDEGFIEELLVINDDLNNAFIRYERFDRLNKAQMTNNQQSSVTSQSLIDLSPPEPATLDQPAVITETSQPAVSTWAAQRQSPSPKEEEEFDMFAQTRGSSLAEQRKSVRYEDPGAVEGLAGALDTRLHVTGGADQSSVSEGVSSEEFDKFLEDRAKSADHSTPATRSVSPSSSRPPPPQSSFQQERSHDQLFSLDLKDIQVQYAHTILLKHTWIHSNAALSGFI